MERLAQAIEFGKRLVMWGIFRLQQFARSNSRFFSALAAFSFALQALRLGFRKCLDVREILLLQ